MKKDKYDYAIENGLVIADEDGTMKRKGKSSGKQRKKEVKNHAQSSTKCRMA